MSTDSFMLGTELMLEPEHIGKLVVIDVYSRETWTKAWRSETHCGILAGFYEDRGRIEDSGDPELDKEPIENLSFEEKLVVKVIFTDGRTFLALSDNTVKARVWFPRPKED